MHTARLLTINDQEIMKVREWIPYMGLVPKVIPLKLFLDIFLLVRCVDVSVEDLFILTSEDIDDLTDIKFVSKIVLQLVGVWSKRLRVFLESLRQSSEIFGKCSATFVWPLDQF